MNGPQTFEIALLVDGYLVYRNEDVPVLAADDPRDDPYFVLKLPDHDSQYIRSLELEDRDLFVCVYVDGICALSIMTIGNRKIRVVSLPSYREDALFHALRIRESTSKLEVEVFASAMDAWEDAFDTEADRLSTERRTIVTTEMGESTPSGGLNPKPTSSSTSNDSTSTMDYLY